MELFITQQGALSIFFLKGCIFLATGLFTRIITALLMITRMGVIYTMDGGNIFKSKIELKPYPLSLAFILFLIIFFFNRIQNFHITHIPVFINFPIHHSFLDGTAWFIYMEAVIELALINPGSHFRKIMR